MVDRNGGSLSGLTEQEAKEFHKLFVASFLIFTLIAIVAHFLVWSWRPWLPGPQGYEESAVLLESVQPVVQSALTMLG